MPSYHSQYLGQAIIDRCGWTKLLLSFLACFMEEKKTLPKPENYRIEEGATLKY
jgi:hypothetical protein